MYIYENKGQSVALAAASFGIWTAYSIARTSLGMWAAQVPRSTHNMGANENLPQGSVKYWQGTHVYVLAAICLLIGLPIGYLFRGSAGAKPATAGRPLASSP